MKKSLAAGNAAWDVGHDNYLPNMLARSFCPGLHRDNKYIVERTVFGCGFVYIEPEDGDHSMGTPKIVMTKGVPNKQYIPEFKKLVMKTIPAPSAL